MKPTRLLSLTALALLLVTGCDRKSSEVAKQLADLERKANEAVEKQRLLEQQVEQQKLAAERDAIERERMRIEEDRAELERRQGEATAAEEEKLRLRETELANREGRLETQQSTLEDKEGDLNRRDSQLSERERELAGREAITREDNRNDEPNVPSADYGMFHDSLSSYGSWFETPDYGYVWQPVIVRDTSWRPYTRGRWACTDRGWTWISDEPFGWATYHYGRWALCRGHGWIWVPGSEWAPSWVSWRSSGSHIGWAPLPPESLAYRGSRWGSTVDVTFGIGSVWFNFVETRHFGSSIHTHCLPYTQNNLYFGETVNITNIYVQNDRVICGGPRYGDIAHQTDRRPPIYRIEEDRHGRPGRDPFGMRPMVQGDRLRVAAPNMDVAWNDGLRPSKVKGRMENIQIERQEELRPEVADRFRKNREESRGKADQTIAEHGGNDAFKQHRQQQLETNRRRIEESTRPQIKPADIARRTEQGKTPNVIGKRDDGPRIHPPKDDGKQEREETQRRQEQTPQRQDYPRIPPPKDDLQKQQEAARLRRLQQEEAGARQREQTRRQEQQTPSRQDQPRIPPPKDDFEKQQEAARLRKQQQEIAEQARQREETQRRQEQTRQNQDKPNIQPPKDNNRQQQEEAQQRQRQQQAQEEAARQRQQQEAAQRQQQARQQQMEEARREQQRQQQENAQRQREQAQQQQRQEERAREQQQRQQQENAERQREQARQQQQEESRREQQREQQRNAERQREQAEHQREQAQQQQRQEESRREQQRQQQDDDNKKQNGRNR